jgi:outer membrane protein OmpA-like peptidoglycan-associated protein
MKRILLMAAVLFIFTTVCMAADDGWQPLNTAGKPEKTQAIKDDGFKSTSGGITESLLSPDKGESSGSKTTESGWKSLKAGEAPTEKTRSIKVLKKKKGVEVWETVKAPGKRTGGFVNLKIQFDVNSYTIRKGSYKILNELGKALSDPRLRERIITVNGHTDSDGKEKYNVRLSLNRAGAVKQYLIDHYNISPDQLKVVGYGESMPLKPNTSKENKQLNRRVEIVAEKK